VSSVNTGKIFCGCENLFKHLSTIVQRCVAARIDDHEKRDTRNADRAASEFTAEFDLFIYEQQTLPPSVSYHSLNTEFPGILGIEDCVVLCPVRDSHRTDLKDSMSDERTAGDQNHHEGHHDGKKKGHRGKERRNRMRDVISAPVRLRGIVGPDRDFDETTTTVNLSPTGILIETTSSSYYRTMRVSITLPYGESATNLHAELEGRVVRITELREGRRSVAIALAHIVAGDAPKTEEAEQAPKSQAANAPTQHDPQPAYEGQCEDEGRLGHEAQHAPTSGAPLVLVVESETAASEFMKTYLSAEGYEVITVKTLPEARNVLEKRTPSLLIAEIEGEGMPGYALCSHCKETPRLKPVPVMLMTSSAYPSDYAKAHAVGAVVCMAKPYKRERLGHVVRLLAPPPNAHQGAPARPADASRLAGAKQSKTPPPTQGRKFRLPNVFGR
jgi:CheY-like chemotaxis protein